MKRTNNRKAAAVVELAICLPVIVLVVLGTIESANMLFLRQALVQSAYESAKIAVHRDGTNAAARLAAEQVAAGRRIQNLTIQFSPGDVASVPRGRPVTVTVSAPGDENCLLKLPGITNRKDSSSAVMVKE